MRITVDILRAVRARADLSCLQSSEVVHVSPCTWYAWEAGRNTVPDFIFSLYLHKTRLKPIAPGARGESEFIPQPPDLNILRCQRQRAALTQSQAAKLVHVHTRTWQNWEAGKTKMHPAAYELFLLKAGWIPVKAGARKPKPKAQDTPAPKTYDAAALAASLAEWEALAAEGITADDLARSKQNSDMYYIAASAPPGAIDLTELE